MKQLYLILGVLAMFFVGGGIAQLNLSNPFTSSDFTMTDTEVVGDNIQLKNDNTVWTNPTWSDVGSIGTYSRNKIAYRTPQSLDPINQYQNLKFCSSHGLSYVSHTTSYNGGTQFYYVTWSGGGWDRPSNDGYGTRISSISCLSDDTYLQSGNIEQTNPITTTERYNYFEVQYTMDSGSVNPYLIVGEEKHYFSNNKLNLDNVPSDTQLKIGFDFTGDSSSTPQLNNDITLLGEFRESSSGGSDDNKALNVLTTLSASSSDKLKTNYLADLVYNFTQPFVDFFKSMF